MEKLLKDVSDFHVACDVPIVSTPSLPPDTRVLLGMRLIHEEVNKELLPAMFDGNLPNIAEGMVDAIYVIVGAALEYGIPLDLVWNAVQSANMAKVDAATGKVLKREDGKVLKPVGWAAPDVVAILDAAMA